METTENKNNEEFELIKKLLKGQKDVDSTYKNSKRIDILFDCGILILLTLVGIFYILGYHGYQEIVVLTIILELAKIALDYKQYKIMMKLIDVEKKIISDDMKKGNVKVSSFKIIKK